MRKITTLFLLLTASALFGNEYDFGIDEPLIASPRQFTFGLDFKIAANDLVYSLTDQGIEIMHEAEFYLGPTALAGTPVSYGYIFLERMVYSVMQFRYGFKPQWQWSNFSEFTWSSIDNADYINEAGVFEFPVQKFVYSFTFSFPWLSLEDEELAAPRMFASVDETIAFRGKYRFNEKTWTEVMFEFPAVFSVLGINFSVRPEVSLLAGHQFNDKTCFRFLLSNGYRYTSGQWHKYYFEEYSSVHSHYLEIEAACQIQVNDKTLMTIYADYEQIYNDGFRIQRNEADELITTDTYYFYYGGEPSKIGFNGGIGVRFDFYRDFNKKKTNVTE